MKIDRQDLFVSGTGHYHTYYSDLCIDVQGNIFCLFECGENHRYEKIALARMDREWLEQNG